MAKAKVMSDVELNPDNYPDYLKAREKKRRFRMRLKRDLNPKLPRNRRILRDTIIGKRARRYSQDSWGRAGLYEDQNYVQGIQHGLFLAEKTEKRASMPDEFRKDI